MFQIDLALSFVLIFTEIREKKKRLFGQKRLQRSEDIKFWKTLLDIIL